MLPILNPAARAATEAWLAASPQHTLLTLDDRAYPPALLQLSDPPPLLYVSGRVDLLAGPALAIVGSRSASRQGLATATAFARHLCATGFTIVSGMAMGIDGAAHDGALQVAELPGTAGPLPAASTVAVIGTGIDVDYPARHARLAERIRTVGAVVTELPPGMPALQHHFPRRNRLIAALSRGTLVVEAAVHSGSLITARLAAELGREVFAIPGSIHSPMARGCHALIRDGAKLVESADDVLDDLAWGTSSRVASADAPSRAGPAPEDPHADVWRALGDDPVPLELLAASTGRAAGDLLAALLELELRRHVERLPGNRYQRLHGA